MADPPCVVRGQGQQDKCLWGISGCLWVSVGVSWRQLDWCGLTMRLQLFCADTSLCMASLEGSVTVPLSRPTSHRLCRPDVRMLFSVLTCMKGGGQGYIGCRA